MNEKKVETHSYEDLSCIDHFLLLPSQIVILLSKVSSTYMNIELTHSALLGSGSVNDTCLTSYRNLALYKWVKKVGTISWVSLESERTHIQPYFQTFLFFFHGNAIILFTQAGEFILMVASPLLSSVSLLPQPNMQLISQLCHTYSQFFHPRLGCPYCLPWGYNSLQLAFLDSSLSILQSNI